MQCDAISTFMMSLEDAKLDHAHDSNAISLKMCTNYMPTDIMSYNSYSLNYGLPKFNSV